MKTAYFYNSAGLVNLSKSINQLLAENPGWKVREIHLDTTGCGSFVASIDYDEEEGKSSHY